jgi:hypothetical protein
MGAKIGDTFKAGQEISCQEYMTCCTITPTTATNRPAFARNHFHFVTIAETTFVSN